MPTDASGKRRVQPLRNAKSTQPPVGRCHRRLWAAHAFPFSTSLGELQSSIRLRDARAMSPRFADLLSLVARAASNPEKHRVTLIGNASSWIGPRRVDPVDKKTLVNDPVQRLIP